MWIILIAILGALIGSFLNVCIFRIPINQELFDEEIYPELRTLKNSLNNKISVSYPPRSFCTKCKAELKWFHNIPIISWLMLGGKCAFCNAPIKVRYPIVELFSACAAVLSILLFDFSVMALVTYFLLASFIVIAFIDLDHFMIPDVITYPLSIIGILLGITNPWTKIYSFPYVENYEDVFLGILAGAGALYVIAKLYTFIRKQEGLGMGDVKLLFVVGVFFGFKGAYVTIFLGSLLGAVIGILILIARGRKLGSEIPFGPYLVVAASFYIFAASPAGQMLLASWIK